MSDNFKKERYIKQQILEDKIQKLYNEYESKIQNETNIDKKNKLKQNLKKKKLSIIRIHYMEIDDLKKNDDQKLQKKLKLKKKKCSNERFKIENKCKFEYPLINQKSEKISKNNNFKQKGYRKNTKFFNSPKNHEIYTFPEIPEEEEEEKLENKLLLLKKKYDLKMKNEKDNNNLKILIKQFKVEKDYIQNSYEAKMEFQKKMYDLESNLKINKNLKNDQKNIKKNKCKNKELKLEVINPAIEKPKSEITFNNNNLKKKLNSDKNQENLPFQISEGIIRKNFLSSDEEKTIRDDIEILFLENDSCYLFKKFYLLTLDEKMLAVKNFLKDLKKENINFNEIFIKFEKMQILERFEDIFFENVEDVEYHKISLFNLIKYLYEDYLMNTTNLSKIDLQTIENLFKKLLKILACERLEIYRGERWEIWKMWRKCKIISETWWKKTKRRI